MAPCQINNLAIFVANYILKIISYLLIKVDRLVIKKAD